MSTFLPFTGRCDRDESSWRAMSRLFAEFLHGRPRCPGGFPGSVREAFTSLFQTDGLPLRRSCGTASQALHRYARTSASRICNRYRSGASGSPGYGRFSIGHFAVSHFCPLRRSALVFSPAATFAIRAGVAGHFAISWLRLGAALAGGNPLRATR